MNENNLLNIVYNKFGPAKFFFLIEGYTGCKSEFMIIERPGFFIIFKQTLILFGRRFRSGGEYNVICGKIAALREGGKPWRTR